MRKWIKRIAIGLLVVLLLIIGGFYIYTLDYYRADETVEDTIESLGYRVVRDDDLTIIHHVDHVHHDKGLIFYPGGKVEAKAYIPLLKALSDEGLTVVLVDMPLNLAVFGINKADKVYDRLPDVKHWFLAGHSLGGAMASSYLDKSGDKIEGLIQLGAYPIDEDDTRTLVIYGTYDLMLDLDKVATADEVLEIVGGNHAQFGNYGIQEGDGQAVISREDQQAQTVEAIMNFISN